MINKISKCLKQKKNCMSCVDINKKNIKGRGGQIANEILNIYTNKKKIL